MRGARPFHALVAAGLLVVVTACSSGPAGAPLPAAGTPTLSTAQAPAENEPSATAPGVLPATLPGVIAPRCVNAPPGWLGRELARRGRIEVPGQRQSPKGQNPLVQGYLDRTYAACGEHLGVHLAAVAQTRVVVEAIRVGAYRGGFTGRLVWRSAPIVAHRQATLPSQPHVTQDNAWPTSLSITPDASWSPGLYLIRFRPLDRLASESYQPLYVLTSGDRAAYLAIGADLTQLAYNRAGGTSLYFGQGATTAARHANRAYVASTHRALAGAGISQLLGMDVPLAVYLARHHITVDWTSDMSLDAAPTQVNGYSTIIIPGHSEYWTRRNYDTLNTAVAHGTNLAVLGANELYWQTRVRRDAQGNVASMTVYRDTTLDPATAPADKTTQWRDAPLRRDPASLTGLGMSGTDIVGDATVVSAPSWLFRGTGVGVGDVLRHVYGNEGDGAMDPHTPANDEILFRSVATTSGHKTALLATAYHSTPSGAGVFNAGTTEWLCGIVNECATTTRTPLVRRVLDQITANLLEAFAQPRAGLRHPSTAGG